MPITNDAIGELSQRIAEGDDRIALAARLLPSSLASSAGYTLNEGALAFWRGNFASVIRYFPLQQLADRRLGLPIGTGNGRVVAFADDIKRLAKIVAQNRATKVCRPLG